MKKPASERRRGAGGARRGRVGRGAPDRSRRGDSGPGGRAESGPVETVVATGISEIEDGRLHRPARAVPQAPAPADGPTSSAAPAPSSSPTPEETAEAADRLGRALSPDQAAWLAGYLADLHRWNRVMNLVGTRTWRETLETLIVDSWNLADFLAARPWATEGGRPLSLDLGAGAGLPGLPLRAFWTAGRYWLVEIRSKRAAFMQGVLARRPRPGTQVFAGSAEALPAELRQADLVLGRAFRPWRELLALAGDLLGSGGLAVVMANQPPPASEVAVEGAGGPVRFRLTAEAAYAAAGGERYFWAFTPVSMPR